MTRREIYANPPGSFRRRKHNWDYGDLERIPPEPRVDRMPGRDQARTHQGILGQMRRPSADQTRAKPYP